MLAVNYSTIRNNLKDYCDKVTDSQETVIVTRKDEKNVCFKLINRGGIPERKIGDIIEYDGNKLKVIEGTCEDCCFNDKPNEFCYALFYMLGSCIPMLRKKTKKPKSICYVRVY